MRLLRQYISISKDSMDVPKPVTETFIDFNQLLANYCNVLSSFRRRLDLGFDRRSEVGVVSEFTRRSEVKRFKKKQQQQQQQFKFPYN